MWFFGKKNKPVDAAVKTKPRMPTVKFDQSRVTPAVEADIQTTLQGLPEIPAAKRQRIYDAALKSIRAGRALNILNDVLIGIGMDKRRAAEIARLVNDRATSLMERERQTALGITEAVWCYSGAPCMFRPKTPSPENIKRNAEHEAVNGKRFPMAKGMLINGRRVWPGMEPGCKCGFRSVIPALDK